MSGNAARDRMSLPDFKRFTSGLSTLRLRDGKVGEPFFRPGWAGTTITPEDWFSRRPYRKR